MSEMKCAKCDTRIHAGTMGWVHAEARQFPYDHEATPAVDHGVAPACSPQESTCSGVESAGDDLVQSSAYIAPGANCPDCHCTSGVHLATCARFRRCSTCGSPLNDARKGGTCAVCQKRESPAAGDVLRDARPPFALGIRDRGNGHYSYAVLEAEGGLYVHCGTDREKAERIILALNARSRTVSLEAQLAEAETRLANRRTAKIFWANRAKAAAARNGKLVEALTQIHECGSIGEAERIAAKALEG